MSVIYTTQDNDTLDWICFNHYGSSEALIPVLEANRHLASLPPLLPQGLQVVLPDWQAPSQDVGGISLW